MTLNNVIKKAEQIAREAHKEQKRWNGEPYINHPLRVANSLEDYSCKIVAWLHDVIEDCNLTVGQLVNKGVPLELAQIVLLLTRGETESYFGFIFRIKPHPIARKVKIADIKDNLNDNLKEGSLKDKYRFALYILREEDEK